MTVQTLYKNILGNYEDALRRFLSEDMIIRFVRDFLSDETYAELIDAVDKGEISASFEAAHKLKGIAGTLAFTQLYNALSELTEQLRPQTVPADPELTKRISLCYHSVIDEIMRFESDAV